MNKINYVLSLVGTWLLSLTLLLTACSDNKEQPANSSGRNLSFSANIEEVYQSATATASRATGSALTTATVEMIDGATTADGEPLYLHTLITDSIGTPTQQVDASRATPITTATMYNSFGLIGYSYDSSNVWSSSLSASLVPDFYQAQATKNSSDVWQAPTAHWAEGKRMAIFAYAPFNLSSSVMVFTPSSATSAGAPTMTYTVPANVADQKDVLVADILDVNFNGATIQPLRFRHALTAVRFITGNNFIGGTVTDIRLKNVYSKATYDMSSNSGSGGWSAYNTPTTYTLFLYQGASATAGRTITGGDNTLFMLPQTLPADAEIEITLRDSLTHTFRTLTKGIGGTTWAKGKTVVYNVSTSSISVTPDFALSTNAISTTYAGGILPSVVLRSQATVTGGGATSSSQVAWTAQYSEDGGNNWSSTAPSWLADIGPSGASTAVLVGTATAQTATTSNTHTDALRALTTSKTDFDLSTNAPYNGSAPKNTANCYIVNEPGTYRLPLVYGNAIKGGVPNESAYSTATTGSYVLPTFQNHTGNGITNPYLKLNSGVVPHNATLVWMDSEGLITNVSYTDEGNGYIKFEVPNTHIAQGNAILAIRDANNTILWSWHIWVTDYVLGSGNTAIKGYNNVSYTFMSQNVGWCDPTTYTYPERSVQIKFTQTGTKATQILTVTQEAFTYRSIGDAPYYQWGRKDPMLPYVGAADLSGNMLPTNSGDKPDYPKPNSYGFTITDAQITTAVSIQTPYTFYHSTASPYNWNSTHYTNLWSMNENSYPDLTTVITANTPVKTVYDPSPVGYMVPPSNAYNLLEQANSSWNDITKIKTLTSGGTITLPAIGFRNFYSGVVGDAGSFGFYWSGVPHNRVASWRLQVGSGLVNPKFTGVPTSAFPIRAIRE